MADMSRSRIFLGWILAMRPAVPRNRLGRRNAKILAPRLV